MSAIIGAIPISKLRYAGKIVGAVRDAFRWQDRVEAARRSFPKLTAAIEKGINKLRRSPGCNSFALGTRVLLADGSTKPIEEVELGDRVVATDPETGESGPQKVVATIVGHGEKELVEVTVDVDGEAGDAVSTIIATAEHPFWVDDPGRLLQPALDGPWGEGPGWYDAEDLDPGDQLRTPTGDKVRVVDLRGYTATTTVHNLTINGVHTYYVVAGDTTVLAHNAKCDPWNSVRKYDDDGHPLDGTLIPTDDALDAAEKWVGPGYKESVPGSGRYVSKDGSRVVRTGEADITGQHGDGPHMNFARLAPNPRNPGKMMVVENRHVYLG